MLASLMRLILYYLTTCSFEQELYNFYFFLVLRLSHPGFSDGHCGRCIDCSPIELSSILHVTCATTTYILRNVLLAQTRPCCPAGFPIGSIERAEYGRYCSSTASALYFSLVC